MPLSFRVGGIFVMGYSCTMYERQCIECGECDICDIDETQICESCGKCLNDEVNFRSVKIKDFVEKKTKKQSD